MASKGLTYQFIPGSYSVVSSKGTSDHHIVKVDLVKLKEVCHHEEKRMKNFTQDIVNATRDSVLCKYL